MDQEDDVMILPEGLSVGVSAARGAKPPFPLAEVGADAVDLLTDEQVRDTAGDAKVITLVGWHVITHKRTDARYKKMKSPPPDQSAVGHFQRSRWTDEAWEQTDSLARSVGAQAVVLRTPATFKATTENATRFENFVAHAMRPGLAVAWEWAPKSWPLDKALELCERIGAVPAVDPFAYAIPDGELVYLRPGSVMPKKAISDDDIKHLVIEARDRTGWVVFANATADEDARRMLDLL